jgi:Putative esterase
MHRSFHSFAILISILSTIMSLIQAWAFSQVGANINYLGSYGNWLLANLILYSMQAFVMLKYFRMRNYKAAFNAGVPYYIALVLTAFNSYSITKLAFGVALYLPINFITLVLQVVFLATVALSASRERTWLRVSSWYGLGMTVILLFLFSIVSSGEFIEYNSAIENFNAPILWASVPTFFMVTINFFREWTDSEATQVPDVLLFTEFLVAASALTFIVTFISDVNGLKLYLPTVTAVLQKAAEPFEARIFVNTEGDSLRYRLLKPLNFDSTRKYPLVVCLHGSGGTGNDNYSQVGTSLFGGVLSEESNRKIYEAFVLVPQCPFGTSWGGVHPLPGIDKLVFEGMTSLEKEFPIDQHRRYVVGASLGGYGAWNFIATHPDVFAAAMPVCGGGDPTLAQKCANVPVWAFHGSLDERVPVNGSRDMIEAMKAAGGHPRYTEFPDTGHDIGRLVIETPGLFDWLFAQRRSENIQKK